MAPGYQSLVGQKGNDSGALGPRASDAHTSWFVSEEKSFDRNAYDLFMVRFIQYADEQVWFGRPILNLFHSLTLLLLSYDPDVLHRLPFVCFRQAGGPA